MSTDDLFHGGDRPRAGMEARLEALFRRGGDVPPRWVPRRLILLNYWLYPYQEFHFGNGRLVLRGPNGSGKTSVLVSAVTLVLDGEKSPSRLDPFGQAGRGMAYYLVGKKEAEEGAGGFYHEDRTGYVALECQHGGDGRFLTIGLGMRGRRQSAGGTPRVDSWGFVLKDGRRLGRGREVELTTPDAVPLNRAELAERIGAGGVVVDRLSDYRAEVNRALFGFPEDDDYAFLVQILLALRSPKLNKELKPSDVAEILSESLPPLDPTLLERVTQIMDDIDATRADIATTEANHARVERVHQAVARHANQVAQERAVEYREAAAAVDHVVDALLAARGRAETARSGRSEAEARLHAADRERAVLRARLKVLRNHQAYRGQDALQDARREEARSRGHHASALAAVSEARAGLAAAEAQRSRLRQRWTEQRQSALARVRRLGDAGRRAAWPHVEQVAEDLRTALQGLEPEAEEPPAFEPAAVEALAAERRQRLEDVLGALEGVGRAGLALEHARSGLDEAEHALREGHGGLREAREAVDAGRDAVAARVERWHRELQELRVPHALVADVRQGVHHVEESDGVPGPLFEPLFAAAAHHRGELEDLREERRARAGALELRRQGAEADLALWEAREEAVPEPRPGQEEARSALAAAGVPAVPLFRAVDVRDPVPPDRARRVHAALLESGLLDALLVRSDDEPEVARLLGEDGGDRWIRPHPHPDGTATLADLLEPAPCELDGAVVRAALRSVALDPGEGEPAAAVTSDGRWGVGLLHGRVAPVTEETPFYLGRDARVRERDRRVAALRATLESVGRDLRAAREEAEALSGRLRRLDAEVDALRHLPEVGSLAHALAVRAERSRRVEQLGERLKEAEDRTAAARRAVGDARQAHEGTLRQAPAARDMDAGGVHGLIGAAEDAVRMAQRVADRLEALREQRGEMGRIAGVLERGRVAAEEAAAREREADEGVAEAAERVRLVETRLAELGHEGVMEEIRRGDERWEALDREGRELAGFIEGLRVDLRHVEAELERLEGERAAAEEERGTARDRLGEAVRAYPTLGEAATRFGDGGEGGAGRAADHLLERREERPTDLRRRIADDRKRAWQGLDHEVIESRSALIDYHPNLDPESGDVTFRHDGRELPPHALLDVLERHRRQQSSVMREKEDELYEEFFLQEVSGRIREAIERAEESVERVNALLADRPLANDEILWLRWRPRREIGADGADHPRLVELLKKPASLLPPDDVRWIKAFFRERVRRVREDTAQVGSERGSGDEPSFAEALQAVLDYRRWFSFTIHGRRPGEPAAEITNREFASRSGGEKSLAMFVPLLAAVDARFRSAREDAPKLVGLDEAFAGVDAGNIQEMFAFMVSLDLSWIMTSEKLWGVGAALPTCTSYQFHRRGTVAAVRLWLWDGRRNVDEASLAVSDGARGAGPSEEGVGAA